MRAVKRLMLWLRGSIIIIYVLSWRRFAKPNKIIIFFRSHKGHGVLYLQLDTYKKYPSVCIKFSRFNRRKLSSYNISTIEKGKITGSQKFIINNVYYLKI